MLAISDLLLKAIPKPIVNVVAFASTGLLVRSFKPFKLCQCLPYIRGRGWDIIGICSYMLQCCNWTVRHEFLPERLMVPGDTPPQVSPNLEDDSD
jgi:hypothetical protein